MVARDLYLNHAGTSWPKPSVVSDAVRDAMFVSPTQWAQRFNEAHQAIADYFGVSKREQILLTPGCTSALAVGLSDALIADGKRILTSSWEHHALLRPLFKLASNGVRVEHIPPEMSDSKSGYESPLDLDWLEQSLSRQDVSLVAITAACNVTGETMPYEQVIRIAQRFGVTILLDAAQIVGWQRMDLPSLGADMVAFGGHKGLQAPWGIGGLYVSDRAKMECVSSVCELPAEGSSSGERPPRPGYCDVGSVDQFALAGLYAAIRMLSDQDVDVCLQNARRQIQRFREKLHKIDGVCMYGARDPDRAMPSLAFSVAGSSSSDIASILKQHSLVVGSGIQCAKLAHETLGTNDTGLVRISVGLGQPDDEIDEAIERIASALG